MAIITPLIAGNWKMNGTAASLSELERLVAWRASAGRDDVEVLVCPPATLLERAARAAGEGAVAVGGQDCHARDSGAHTGDVSASMLADAGARYVILGHSERRADHGETDGMVAAKVKAALSAGLVPVICVGETESQRDAGDAERVVSDQLAGSLPDELAGGDIIVAYEPVWAIGTGRTPSTDDIFAMHATMRDRLVSRFGDAGAKARLLYGGSVKPDNAAEILALANVDGALVGGASLTARSFSAIIAAAPVRR